MKTIAEHKAKYAGGYHCTVPNDVRAFNAFLKAHGGKYPYIAFLRVPNMINGTCSYYTHTKEDSDAVLAAIARFKN